jgi:hypothetical protein
MYKQKLLISAVELNSSGTVTISANQSAKNGSVSPESCQKRAGAIGQWELDGCPAAGRRYTSNPKSAWNSKHLTDSIQAPAFPFIHCALPTNRPAIGSLSFTKAYGGEENYVIKDKSSSGCRCRSCSNRILFLFHPTGREAPWAGLCSAGRKGLCSGDAGRRHRPSSSSSQKELDWRNPSLNNRSPMTCACEQGGGVFLPLNLC